MLYDIETYSFMDNVRDLPTYYYHTHFHEFLKFVTGPCASLLDQEDQAFIQSFQALNKDQQCLIIRFVNRKSIFIKPSAYDYDEIDNIDDNFYQLFQDKWFKPIQCKHAAEFVENLTKTEILSLLEEINVLLERPIAYKKSAPKLKLVEILITEVSAEQICDSSIASDYWEGNFERPIYYFLYLYFGNFHAKLNQFSMRDLGVMRTRKEQAQVLARFDSIDSAKSAFNLHFQLNDVRIALANFKHATPKEADQVRKHKKQHHAYLTEQLSTMCLPIGDKAVELHQRLQLLLANDLLAFDATHALDVLQNIGSSAASEKWIREAYKQGHTEAVEARLEKIIQEPLCEDLLAFAEDFLARKYHKKRTSVLTDMLRENSQTIAIDEIHKGAVERGVVAYYEQRKVLALRTENEIWRALFGLYFWREIYELEGLGLSNEFDHVPTSLKSNQFYELAKEQIEARLSSTDSKASLFKQLSFVAAQHYGEGNIVFRWRKNILERLNLLIKHSELSQLLSLLRFMTQDWQNLSDGFPDLMLIENDKLRFEEVKSEGDQLRRNQLLSIQKLQSLGFDVRITNVVWTFDPMQTYVVVDIETTGGRAQHHRITEVGMVKVSGGEVIAEWQSLINPQRRIPANITSLTGIDNELVANAPLFAEVADDIDEFTQDCVFVAHNVNFDYGFIKAEFERLERRFRRPKLCTVREMRKYYKGLPSYSLANLTKHFDIDMQRHHRAMSDAVAASELLSLINEKRVGYQID